MQSSRAHDDGEEAEQKDMQKCNITEGLGAPRAQRSDLRREGGEGEGKEVLLPRLSHLLDEPKSVQQESLHCSQTRGGARRAMLRLPYLHLYLIDWGVRVSTPGFDSIFARLDPDRKHAGKEEKSMAMELLQQLFLQASE